MQTIIRMAPAEEAWISFFFHTKVGVSYAPYVVVSSSSTSIVVTAIVPSASAPTDSSP